MKKYNIAITGASKGLGKHLALNLASQNRHFFLSARDEEALKQSKQDLEKLACSAEFYSFDVGDERMSYEWCERIFKQRLDLLILNAGISSGLDDSAKKQIQVSKVNCLGVANIIFHALEYMQKQELIGGKRGHIVLMASIASFVCLPNAPSYSASKHYLKSLAQSLSMAYPEIKITLICPGFIKTELTKHINNKYINKIMLDVDVAAKKITKAIEKEKRFYAFPFYLFFLAKLYSLLPKCLQKICASKVRL